MINFWARGAVPCHALEPIYEKVAAHFAGNTEVVFLSADCDEDESLVGRIWRSKPRRSGGIRGWPDELFKVESFPTVLILDRGARLFSREWIRSGYHRAGIGRGVPQAMAVTANARSCRDGDALGPAGEIRAWLAARVRPAEARSAALRNNEQNQDSLAARGTGRGFCGDFLRGDDGVGVDADGVFDAARIAASECRDDGNVAVTGGFGNPLVASLEAGLCQAQATELVFTKRIGPAHVEKNIGAKFVERSFYCRQENCQVFSVSHAIVEAEIEIGWGFVGRLVIFLMDGKRED